MTTNTTRMAAIAATLRGTSFFRMPASDKVHNTFEGGLLDHCTHMWLKLEDLTNKLGLTWKDPGSPFIIAMLHDAWKIDAYFYNHDYKCWESLRGFPVDEGEASLRVIDSLGIDLTAEERECIRWVGGFPAQHDEALLEQYANAMESNPNILWTRVADVSAFIEDCNNNDTRSRCCLCGDPIAAYGNNPWPLADEGECCDRCNFTKVLPARMGGAHNEK